MNKAYGITANLFSELIDKINKFAQEHKIFSTQFLEPDRNTFYCVVWYEENTKINDSSSIETKNQSNKEELITEAQYKAIMKISKTPDGEDYLKSKGVYSEENVKRLTKKQAWKYMDEFNKLKE